MKLKISKWVSLGVAAICAVVAVTTSLSFVEKRKAAEKEIRQAERTKAMAEAKSAEEKRLARDRELAAAQQRAENLKAESVLKDKTIAEETARTEAENAKRLRAEEENKVAQANLKTAEENRKAKEAERAALELAVDLAGATNESMRLSLELTEKSRVVAERTAEAKKAELKTQELLKAEYAKLIAEQKELNEILREREEYTRPDKTLAMLVEENNERRRQEMGDDWKPDYEYSEQPTYELHEGPATGFKKPTANDFRLAAIGERKDKEVEAKLQLSRRRIVSEFEGMIRKAVGDGRKDAAEFYLQCLVSLVPDYTPDLEKIAPNPVGK